MSNFMNEPLTRVKDGKVRLIVDEATEMDLLTHCSEHCKKRCGISFDPEDLGCICVVPMMYMATVKLAELESKIEKGDLKCNQL